MKFEQDYVGNYSRIVTSPKTEAATRMDFQSNAAVFLRKIGVDKYAAQAISGSLLARMSDPSLFYHSPVHVLSMFQFAKINKIEIPDWMVLAIWFHDAIYKPIAPDESNEVCSALFMHSLLSQDLPQKLVCKAFNAIMSTAYHHEPNRVAKDYRLLLDLDTCNFSWSFDNYEAASEMVEKEFHAKIKKSDWIKGRKEFLTKIMNRPRIYRTNHFQKFEEKARDNLSCSLEKIKK